MLEDMSLEMCWSDGLVADGNSPKFADKPTIVNQPCTSSEAHIIHLACAVFAILGLAWRK